MALSKLENLYRQVILDHSSHPRNKGLVNKSDVKIVELHNPTCGDVIQLQVEVDNYEVIQEVRFEGYGCSISTASASMMTEVMKGKTLPEAMGLVERFSQMVQGEKIDDKPLLDAAILSGVQKFPARIKCATLAWKALERLINEDKKSKNRGVVE